MITPKLSNALDFCRWLAAFTVLTGHVHMLVFSSNPEWNVWTAILFPFRILSGFGHEAVIVFFVISGLLVGGLTLDEARRKPFSITEYGIKRFSRIYTVLIPALLIGGLLDYVGMTWFDGDHVYSGNPERLWLHVMSLGWDRFFGNLIMLESVFDTYGSNRPLWSLGYEWWYYCIFGLALLAIAARRISVKIAVTTIIVALLVLLSPRLTVWGLFWMLGVGVYEWRRRGLWVPPLWAGLLLFALALGVSELSGPIRFKGHNIVRDMIVALGFATALVALPSGGGKPSSQTLNARLADFSFTLYVFHLPIILLAVAILNDVFGFRIAKSDDAVGLGVFLGVGTIALIAAYGLSRVFEARTGLVRRWLFDKTAGLRSQETLTKIV